MTITQSPPVRAATVRHPPSAVASLNGRRAVVATMSAAGIVTTCEFDRGTLSEAEYLAQLVRVIGERERVLILGPTSVRLALEREYVAGHGRPHHLVDVEPAGDLSTAELRDRLAVLAS